MRQGREVPMYERISPLAALLGMLLGAGATALADRRRWRREAVTRLLELRTELYAEYLVAMEETGRDLLRVLRTTSAEDRETSAEVAFAGSTSVAHGSGSTSWLRSMSFGRPTRSFGGCNVPATTSRLRTHGTLQGSSP
ncbi:hypothetical protein [Streptomyces sp. Wh19]|uniref:hypothetical protein n=1 Tax=Streptomyces sp. Wh19 TaxID=3076629 RepID=UPI002958913D|nr:hypothetical protein [Streptomyces sp. Wh19]MDV9197437.1 hypothetical protein [Streptomyces sp. Wh19]